MRQYLFDPDYNGKPFNRRQRSIVYQHVLQPLPRDNDKYPAGVVTQNPALYKSLDAADKRIGMANFHAITIKATVELMEASGFKDLNEITVSVFSSRMDAIHTKRFDQIYGTDDNINIAKKCCVALLLYKRAWQQLLNSNSTAKYTK